jgi:RAB protein geranylgeranyltransferase component A
MTGMTRHEIREHRIALITDKYAKIIDYCRNCDHFNKPSCRFPFYGADQVCTHLSRIAANAAIVKIDEEMEKFNNILDLIDSIDWNNKD